MRPQLLEVSCLEILKKASRQAFDVGRSGVLDALVGMMHLRRVHHQSAFQGRERQALIEIATQVPAAQTTREDIHEHGQVQKLNVNLSMAAIGEPRENGYAERLMRTIAPSKKRR